MLNKSVLEILTEENHTHI